MAMVRNADYEEIALVFHGLLAGIVGRARSNIEKMTSLRTDQATHFAVLRKPSEAFGRDVKLGVHCQVSVN